MCTESTECYLQKSDTVDVQNVYERITNASGDVIYSCPNRIYYHRRDSGKIP